MKGRTVDTRMKRLCDILFILSLLLNACSVEDHVNDSPEAGIPIGFSGDVPITRVTKEYTEIADLTNMGVFAYFTHGDFDVSTATPNFMYNQLVERQMDGTWLYSPFKFWPNNPTDKISFFAYAPYTNEDGAAGSNPSFQDRISATGFPILSYTVPPTENNQIDLLAAAPVMNLNGGKVSFKLYHTLTKVNIYVKSNDNTEGKSVNFFSITGKKSGALTYYDPKSGDAKGWKWIYPFSEETEIFTADILNFSLPNTIMEEKKLLATFFLLPDGEGSKFSITYQYIAKDNNNIPITQTVMIENQDLPSTDNWNPGTSLSYTIGIARKTITVMSENGLVSWEATEPETVKGTEEK